MSIKSTIYISRDIAESRIQEIINKIINGEWIDLYSTVYEDDYFMHELVNNSNDNFDDFITISKNFGDIEKWPNRFLEQFMDRPGIRYSMFENYIIE